MSSLNTNLSDLIKPVEDIKSDNLSRSELELLVNKKKIIKENEIPVSEIIQKSPDKKTLDESIKSLKSNTLLSTNPRQYEHVNTKKVSKKTIEQENEDPLVRKEKSELISKINRLNNESANKYGNMLINMDISLYDLRNELQRLETELANEQKLKMLRTGLSFTVQGLEWLNTSYDPLGVDLVGWSNSLNIQLETKQYDKVLMEIYEKYFAGESNLPPEVRLVGMLIISGVGFAFTKKMQTTAQTKLEKMMENIRPTNLPDASDLRKPDINSETVDDPMPSKIPPPEPVDIQNILNKMKQHNNNNNNTNTDFLESEDNVKSINVSSTKKRGRKKKNK